MRRFLVLVLACFAATLGARTAYACSCVGPVPLEEALRHAEVAFVGEVVGRDGFDTYEVRVDGVLKGDVDDVVKLRVWKGSSSSCGTSLDYGPLLYTGERKLEINACSWRWTGADVSTALTSAKVVPTPVVHASPTSRAPEPVATGDRDDAGGFPVWPVAAGLAAAAAAAAALAVWRSRRPGPAGPR